MLSKIRQFIQESNSTNSNTDKLAVIKAWSGDAELKQALRYTYDTFKQYYVTSENCKKRSDLIAPFSVYDNLIDLLDALNGRVITGHAAIEAVNRFVEDNKEYEDEIWCVIERNLKTRSTVSMINKVIPGLVPTFDVALAQAYDAKTAKKVNWKEGWFVSRKLDGVRCITIIDGAGEPKFYSRAGNEFTTLGALVNEIKKLGLSNMVLDGEICIVDQNGNEDFQGIIKQIKRKDYTISNPFYHVFDILTVDEFGNQTSTRTFSERQQSLNDLMVYSPMMAALEQVKVNNDSTLELWTQMAKDFKWEGLMLRKDTVYQGKRSADVLKVKQFHDAEYIVLEIESAINRVIVDGKEVEEEMMKHVIIEHKGNRVQVGSGFSQEEKRYYFANPDKIIGKQITVQYFEETTNQHGENSLRFPVVKAIYETNRNF